MFSFSSYNVLVTSPTISADIVLHFNDVDLVKLSELRRLPLYEYDCWRWFCDLVWPWRDKRIGNLSFILHSLWFRCFQAIAGKCYCRANGQTIYHKLAAHSTLNTIISLSFPTKTTFHFFRHYNSFELSPAYHSFMHFILVTTDAKDKKCRRKSKRNQSKIETNALLKRLRYGCTQFRSSCATLHSTHRAFFIAHHEKTELWSFGSDFPTLHNKWSWHAL